MESLVGLWIQMEIRLNCGSHRMMGFDYLMRLIIGLGVRLL